MLVRVSAVDETTLNEAWSVGEMLSGEDFSDYPRALVVLISLKVNAEPVEEKAKLGFLQGVIYGSAKALYIRGDSAVAKAVDDGVLDSHAQYPQHEFLTLENAGKKFYSGPPVFKYDY
ncbi:hypothetical protein DL96DRAFT_1563523 [Flagelloscypha sp. PMI_526]|nr:hypothetical protein DL96DRAFT_1563523 [Flagelloscypha sp. PMI_526]